MIPGDHRVVHRGWIVALVLALVALPGVAESLEPVPVPRTYQEFWVATVESWMTETERAELFLARRTADLLPGARADASRFPTGDERFASLRRSFWSARNRSPSLAHNVVRAQFRHHVAAVRNLLLPVES
ncbi:MAG: hypothetical protein R3190_01220, partial [Thermoanaerobaculia bacterium]|nr:hypothetical protein [Thermoanaerobaculia bacterium]